MSYRASLRSQAASNIGTGVNKAPANKLIRKVVSNEANKKDMLYSPKDTKTKTWLPQDFVALSRSSHERSTLPDTTP